MNTVHWVSRACQRVFGWLCKASEFVSAVRYTKLDQTKTFKHLKQSTLGMSVRDEILKIRLLDLEGFGRIAGIGFFDKRSICSSH